MAVKGLVSVIIPTYNRFDLVHRAIQSALEQTYANLEVIVVNDCSTDKRYYDGSLEKYERTKVIHLPKNQRDVYNVTAAQGAVRQIAIESAVGEWIAFLDDDDRFLSDKIERQLTAIEKTPHLMCSTNMYIVNSEMSVTGLYLRQSLPTVFNSALIRQVDYINNSTVLIHHSILKKAGPCLPEKHEDWRLWLRCLLYTDCLYLSDPLVFYMMAGQAKNYSYN